MKKFLQLLPLTLIITLSSFAQVVSINPDSAIQGQTLITTITMTAGQFSMGSPPFMSSDIYLQQGATIIYTYSGYSMSNVYWGTDSLWTQFDIPGGAPLGYYDLHVVDYDQFFMPTDYVLPNAFLVSPPDGTIEGDIFNDVNQNGVHDGGEAGLQNQRVLLTPGNIVAYTNAAGHYIAYLGANNYTVSYQPAWGYIQTTVPVSYSATVPPSYTGFDFGAHSQWISNSSQDFYIWHHPMRCQPSLGYTYVDINNNGNDSVHGSVTMVHSSNLILNTAQPAPDIISGDTLTWYYSTLNPGQTYHIGGGNGMNWISFNDPPAGQTVWYNSVDSVFDLSGNPVTQYFDTFSFVVSCSCDPNDKWVSPEGNTSQHYTPPNTDLTYNINFQNTGNDTALTVTVLDTLDANLDWNTFEVISSTHPVFAQMDPNGVVTFTFPNIMLPDSNVNEPASHGSVAYRIRTDSLLPDPTAIQNTGYIYFDVNTAVVTNKTLNTITALEYPSASFSTGDLSFCPGSCIAFSNLSTPGSSYQWSFPGANPSSSTDPDPANICYTVSGNYDVQLIASNALGADTVVYSNYIEVFSVAPQAITQAGDTLIANQGFVNYVWYYNGNIISGATEYFYVAQQNGDYHVISFDANGCDVEAAAFNVMTSAGNIQPMTSIEIYPNPVTDRIEILGVTPSEILFYNVLGEKVLTVQPQASGIHGAISADVSMLAKGVYTAELKDEHHSYRTTIVKQ
jgi:uncharacterized repeat protein (TIGR01451 family)